MDEGGWIKLHRGLLKKGWYKDSDYVHLWIYLLMRANYEPNEWLYKNTIHKVERGQFITSRKTIVRETGINRSKVERILNCFKNEQQIEQQNLHTSRLITIINYNEYQGNEQVIEQPVSSQRAASEQPVSTNKNIKNDKNDKKKDNMEKRTVFTIPTIEELNSYSKEIGYKNFDSGRFLDYYEARGWMIGKNKMKSWKGAVRLWKRNDAKSDIQSMDKIEDAVDRITNPKIGEDLGYVIKRLQLNENEIKEVKERISHER